MCCHSVPYDASPEGMADKIKHQRENILRENMSLIEEKLTKTGVPGKGPHSAHVADYDYGFSLHVTPDDPDGLHIDSHVSFLKEQSKNIRPQAVSRMLLHIKKHKVQKETKEAY